MQNIGRPSDLVNPYIGRFAPFLPAGGGNKRIVAEICCLAGLRHLFFLSPLRRLVSAAGMTTRLRCEQLPDVVAQSDLSFRVFARPL
ncbi:MAG: hypothetical protein ACJ8E0_11745 [Sphingomicrobium sp.]